MRENQTYRTALRIPVGGRGASEGRPAGGFTSGRDLGGRAAGLAIGGCLADADAAVDVVGGMAAVLGAVGLRDAGE